MKKLILVLLLIFIQCNTLNNQVKIDINGHYAKSQIIEEIVDDIADTSGIRSIRYYQIINLDINDTLIYLYREEWDANATDYNVKVSTPFKYVKRNDSLIVCDRYYFKYMVVQNSILDLLYIGHDTLKYDLKYLEGRYSKS